MDYSRELQIAEHAAVAGGRIVAAHYATPAAGFETKPDHSPVTRADRDANARIIELLTAALPDDAILSEELPDDPARLTRRRVWIIDPLDGTRDFVARTGEFSVHVGLAVDGEPVVGAVYQPVTGHLYAARVGGGAWCVAHDQRRRLTVSTTAGIGQLRIGVSRLHRSDRLARFLAASDLTDRAIAMGASVKHMAVAAGTLDAVVSLSSGEHEWDTCAPDIVIREAGGLFTDGDGRPFRYNRPDLVHHRGSIASNHACHAELVALVGASLATAVPP